MEAKKKILITSALPYVNNVPHLGNIVGSVLSGDVYARYHRLVGNDVLYLCGTDEYGTTTEIKALQENLTPRQICDKYHVLHKNVYDGFNIKFDVWGRTSTSTQTEITHKIFLDLYKAGHIEEKDVEQQYCEKCNLYLADRYLHGLCYHKECKDLKTICNGDQCDKCGNLIDVEKLVEYWCGVCKSKPIKKTSSHLYLRLNDFEDKLREYFLDPEHKICRLTHNAYAITKEWLNRGLESRCITRDLKWGTSLPDIPELKKFRNKVFYVWFDAPIGYLSILAHERKDWKEWLSQSDDIVQFMAKDNVPFHTIIYPATLMGTKLGFPLVTQISSTEYLDFEGTKFSKSKNIGIFGDNALEINKKLNIDADYWRYYLMKIRPETSDSSFNVKSFALLIKTELCHKLGNFINRCVQMKQKYFPNDKLPYDGTHEHCTNIEENIRAKILKYHECFKNFKFINALSLIMEVADFGNTYIQVMTPWVVHKTDPDACKVILGRATYICYVLLTLMFPILPGKSEKLLKNIILCSNFNIFDEQKYTGDIVIDVTGYEIPFIQVDETELLKMVNVETGDTIKNR